MPTIVRCRIFSSDQSLMANLLDGVTFGLAADGWAPQIAGLRPAGVVGVGPYEDVEETLQITLIGTPGTQGQTQWDAINLLRRLLELAARHARGEAVQPVWWDVQYASRPAVTTRVLGGDVLLPADLADLRDTGAGTTLELRVRRIGMWLGDSETASAPNVSTTTALFPASFAGPLAVAGPMQIRVGWLPGYPDREASVPAEPKGNGILLVQPTGAAVAQLAAAQLPLVAAPGSSYQIAADTAHNAHGGNILYCAGGTIELLWTLPAGYLGARLAVLALAKRGGSLLTTAPGFTLQARVRVEADAANNLLAAPPNASLGPVIPIPNAYYTAALSLGTVAAPGHARQLSILFAGTGDCSLDYIVVAVLTEETRVIALPTLDLRQSRFIVQADAAALGNAAPQVLQESDVGFTPYGAVGDAFLASSASGIQVVPLFVNQAHWLWPEASGVPAYTGITVSRRPAYLVPP
jgi:hypothetical protein